MEAALSAAHDRAAAAAAAAAETETALKAGKDALLRLNAEFQNFRNRTEREKTVRNAANCLTARAKRACMCSYTRYVSVVAAQEISDRVKGNVLEELIPLIDNFEAAKQYIKARALTQQRICAAAAR
jgi:molecular chaperone GrpE